MVLTVSVDDHCKIAVNDHILTEKTGAYNSDPVQFDLTPFVVFMDGKTGKGVNSVNIWATNESGVGGVAYKVEITLIS